jgi:dimeric dUTPase (all-alpha-NTP-PPase superfamily)
VKNQIISMLQLQDEMNCKVHPQWREQGYQWYRAIWIECAELMEHHGWKWWKKQQPDQEQVILELIDIWHFGLSSLLQKQQNLEIIADHLQTSLEMAQLEGGFLESVEAFAASTLNTQQFDEKGFAKLLKLANISADQLYRSYVGKNVLNFFRQDHGYKEGRYHKEWQGKEDNVHLVEVLEILDIYSANFRDDVYQALALRYPA